MKMAVFLGFAGSLLTGAALAGDVTIAVSGVENADGALRTTLCRESEYDSWSCALRETVAAQPGGASVLFQNVPPGRYAIKVFHDSDGDGELDRDLFGAPSEDYGFSNDARGTFGPPDFIDAAVSIGEEPASFKVRVR